MKVSPARQAAFDVLWRVESEAAYAANLLASSHLNELSREDRALAQELTLGALRWQLQLDSLIEHFARRRISKLDLAAVVALRLGLYQLLFLTRTPAHAAINESVNLVKARGLNSAAPFVNAVLRSAQRAGADGVRGLIESINDPLRRLSVETSHPAWLLNRWINRFGADEARALALANNAPPRTAFRFNPCRASEEQTRAWLAEHGISISNSALTPGAAVIESGSLSASAEPVREGWVYLQDEASQLVAHLAANLKSQISNLKFIDLCAAPGGKTTLAASLLPADTLTVACDIHSHRLRTTEELAARLGITSLCLLQLDAARDLPFAEEQFDLVLLDAPCTGTGTLQRHPEIKWRTGEEKVAELAELQRKLITQAARQVRPGGLLTYSVCSTEPEEGEEIIAWFRSQHSEYRDVTRERLAELSLDPAELLTPTHGARTFTHRHGAESFFACVLWKRKDRG
jgi:16S rRNA (cytosine967-C5)-methyltransferase